MERHRGMRPHDIVILLKIASKKRKEWYMKDLARELEISAGEVSESLRRSVYAGLIGSDKRTLNRLALLDFLRCGLPYVFPQRPGPVVRGIPTAHSAPPLNAQIHSSEVFVWPWNEGTARGQAIVPLYPGLPAACMQDQDFYELMALTEALRVGRTREKKLATEMLKARI